MWTRVKGKQSVVSRSKYKTVPVRLFATPLWKMWGGQREHLFQLVCFVKKSISKIQSIFCVFSNVLVLKELLFSTEYKWLLGAFACLTFFTCSYNVFEKRQHKVNSIWLPLLSIQLKVIKQLSKGLQIICDLQWVLRVKLRNCETVSLCITFIT